MWLLFSLLCLGSAAALNWQTFPAHGNWTALRENSSKWRILVEERRLNHMTNNIEPEEGVSLVHRLRLLGFIVLIAQAVFVIHLTRRVFLVDDYDECAAKVHYVRLGDVPRRRRAADKDATRRTAESPTLRNRCIATPLPPGGSTPLRKPEKIVSAEAASDGLLAADKGKAKKAQREQSTRLPRPKKGEDNSLIGEMELMMQEDDENAGRTEQEKKRKGDSPGTPSEAKHVEEDETMATKTKEGRTAGTRNSSPLRASPGTTSPGKTSPGKTNLAKATPRKSNPGKQAPSKEGQGKTTAGKEKERPGKQSPENATPGKQAPSKEGQGKATPGKQPKEDETLEE